MKKRILALALAGTTAFSVFGAAMSANAAWWDSSHVNAYDGSYYKTYNPAGNLRWGVNTTGSDYAEIKQGFLYAATDSQWANLPENEDGKKILTAGNVYTVGWATSSGYGDAEDYINKYNDEDLKNFKYYTNYEDFADEIGYTDYVTEGINGQVNIGDDNQAEYIIAQYKDGSYFIFPKEDWDKNWGADSDHNSEGDYKNGVVAEGTHFFLPEDKTIESTGTQLLTLTDFMEEYEKETDYWYAVAPSGTTMATLTATNMQKVSTNDVDGYVVYTGAADVDTLLVNADGEAVTKLNTVVSNFEDVMATAVVPDGTVYLYDYLDDLPIDEEDFIDAWADETLPEVLAETEYPATYGTIYYDTGYRGDDIRKDVMYAWEDFLDDLGISDHSNNGLKLWAEDVIDNYAYQYHDADVITKVEHKVDGSWEITVSSKDVDLYNFEQLIEDILKLAPADEAEDAQTSELVYLMQQYNRYVADGFVDVNPVETDDWGDLLVALAQAPTEDEFRTANRYKSYTNKVEDLVEQYEEAETSVAVRMAEEELYEFVTNYYDSYAVDERADTTVLATAIDNTYFNYDWRGKQNYSTDGDGVLDAKAADQVIDEYGNAWALYPQDDYKNYTGAYTGEYPGVDGTVEAISNVTSEYGWFYNVYALAYDVYTGNRYQSVVDLMATTLDEAVAALVPSENAYASEILGAEEQNEELADLVETDYNSDMWANRNKIYTYVTERVSNDEIGHNGSDNAADIAELTYDVLGWQKYQTSVTRTDINSVKTAKSEAEAALKALQDDEDNYNAAQANALEAAIENCDYLIDLYNGEYSRSNLTQSVNTEYNAGVGDKDQLLKSMIDDAVQEVDDAINFAGIIMGWSQDDEGNWMYGTEEGYLNDGWHQVDGGNTWFYFNEDGTAKQSEWWQDGSTWYWFNSNCGAAVGWAKINNDWYYFKGNNAMKTGWEKVEGSWYYMNSSGKMVTGWCQINGTWYYFSKESNALGQMLANTTTPDGYKVDANGALVE